MEKTDAVKLAVKLVLALVENKELVLDSDKKGNPAQILKTLEDIAKGILEIEKKL